MTKTKTDYILESLRKIAHKKWELFIISRIIHKLDDGELEFITQQLVRMPNHGRRFLTDLYFPQLDRHLEVDERFHLENLEKDRRREQDIVQTTQHNVSHISTANRDKTEKPLELICEEVDQFVDLIQELKALKQRDGKFIPWDWEFRYSSAPIIERGYLDCEDNVTFRLQVEALRCFGFSGKGYQRGAWKIPDETGDWVWFPRLYEHYIWHNEMSDDGKIIFQRALNKDGQAHNAMTLEKSRGEPDGNVIVFAKAKDSLGANLLRYVGTFRRNFAVSNADAIQFDLVKTREKVRVG